MKFALFDLYSSNLSSQFWVLVENDVGKGNYSTVVLHQTLPSYPTGVVKNVQAKSISATEIEVAWEPVDLVRGSQIYLR